MMTNESAMNLLADDSTAKGPSMKPVTIITYVSAILHSLSAHQPKSVQSQLRIATEATHAVVRCMTNEKGRC